MSTTSWQDSFQTRGTEQVQHGNDSRAKVDFTGLTCRMSFGGITMTKLSGKKPQRPFSSPSHQPSSSVSFTVRINSHNSLLGRREVNRWSGKMHESRFYPFYLRDLGISVDFST